MSHTGVSLGGVLASRARLRFPRQRQNITETLNDVLAYNLLNDVVASKTKEARSVKNARKPPPFAPDASADHSSASPPSAMKIPRSGVWRPVLSVRICEDLWENILVGQCHVKPICKEERN